MGESIVVTGGSGFIGTYICEILANAGYSVINYDYSPPSPGSECEWLLEKVKSKIAFIKGDIRDFYGLIRTAKEQKVNAIVHAAALTDVELLQKSPTLSLQINTLGTVNALEAARILGLKRIIAASSIAVYAPKQYEPMDESHPVLLPNQGPALSSYSSSKLAAEAFGMHYWAEYGVPYVALRFSGVYGLGMKYPMYIKTILENALQGKPTHIETGGDAARDFVYVRDVAKAVLLALEKDERNFQSRVFNIAHGGPLTNVHQLAQTVQELLPQADICVGPGLTPYEAKIQHSRGSLSIQRAKDDLGYQPHYGLNEGVREYIKLFEDCHGRNKK